MKLKQYEVIRNLGDQSMVILQHNGGNNDYIKARNIFIKMVNQVYSREGLTEPLRL